jgi:hypothetical protein
MPTITIDNIHDMRPMPSIARMARLLSGSMWRPRDWNTETPQTVADDAVAFLRCAGLVSFTRNKAAIRPRATIGKRPAKTWGMCTLRSISFSEGARRTSMTWNRIP